MGAIVERAKELRKIIEENADAMSDEESLDYPELFPNWHSGIVYVADNKVRFEGKLYRCVQAHTSQDDWTPDATPALWVNIAEPGDEWPEWVQPTGGHDAYKLGDKVSHKEKHWVSLQDNNVWEPGLYGWEEQA